MTRHDSLGITSTFRNFGLDPKHYCSVDHFFRTDSWELPDIVSKWSQTVTESEFAHLDEGGLTFLLDGVKQSKEGRFMPGVKKLHQESKNSGKSEYIHGHMFGGAGVVAGNSDKLFSVPLSMSIHDGISEVFKWTDEPKRHHTHPVQMFTQTYTAALASDKPGVAVGDRYFFSVPVLEKRLQLIEENGKVLHLVSKSKRPAVAYQLPPERIAGQRGRPRIRGEKLKLKDPFDLMADDFLSAQMEF